MAMAAKKKAGGSGSRGKGKAAAPEVAAARDEAGGLGPDVEQEDGAALGRDVDGGEAAGVKCPAESPCEPASSPRTDAEHLRVQGKALPEHLGVQGEALPKPLPVKSPDVLKRVVYVDVRKNVQADDYPGIHGEIRQHYEGALNLRKSLALLRDELRDCKKGIRAEEAEVERLNAMIASGEMLLKDERVIETWDYLVGSIASEVADEDKRAAAVEIPMREMLSFEKQRALSFKTPHEDCYNCKYVRCRGLEGRVCQNFADCVNCPDSFCEGNLIDDGGEDCCGFGKYPRHDASKLPMFVDEGTLMEDEFKRLDCFFCPDLRCDADMAHSCGRKSDCAECGSASCSNKISGADCALGKSCGMPF